ncbi:MAG: saccharopine dehydrogenase NADP-binding domain-containing protein, partial [Anaerolineales bacterium]
MRITVLGGAGKMGCIAVQDLTNNEAVDQVIIADVQVDQANQVAEFLDSPKVLVHPVDTKDPDYLVKAIQGSQVCLNATVYYTNLHVMEACLQSGVHYTDMGGLFHTTRKQLMLHDRFADAGLSAVLGMGS